MKLIERDRETLRKARVLISKRISTILLDDKVLMEHITNTNMRMDLMALYAAQESLLRLTRPDPENAEEKG